MPDQARESSTGVSHEPQFSLWLGEWSDMSSSGNDLNISMLAANGLHQGPYFPGFKAGSAVHRSICGAVTVWAPRSSAVLQDRGWESGIYKPTAKCAPGSLSPMAHNLGICRIQASSFCSRDLYVY